jgi:hypothetical protein
VFALRLIRRKFAKNPIDLIRCKFSIDAGFRGLSTAPAHPPFRNHKPAGPETRHSPFGSNAPPGEVQKPREAAVLRVS